MNVRLGNSGDFHALLAVMRESRERRAEPNPVYRVRPDADERSHRWIGELAADPRSMMLLAEEDRRVV
jgi:hypothetical protein